MIISVFLPNIQEMALAFVMLEMRRGVTRNMGTLLRIQNIQTPYIFFVLQSRTKVDYIVVYHLPMSLNFEDNFNRFFYYILKHK